MSLSCSVENNSEITIPFSYEYGRIVLDAVINRQAGKFIFDTGSFYSFAGVSTLGLFPIGYTETIIGGKRKNNLVYSLNRIQIGDVKIKSRSMLINRDDVITRIKKVEEYDGILGIRTFEGFWMELSFSRNEIILHKQKPEYFEDAIHSRLEMMSKFSVLYLPIDIDGNKFLMNIDTGLQQGFFFPNDIINDKPPEDLRLIASNGEIGDFYLVRTNSINVMDRTYSGKLIMNNSYTAARRFWESHTDTGIMGLAFMRHYDFLFDYRNLRDGKTAGMYYIPLTPPEERDYSFFSFLIEAPGLGVINACSCQCEEGMTIFSVLTDSPAYIEYGLKPGSVITKINGKPVHSFSMNEIRDPLFFDWATELTVLNDEKDGEVHFKLK